MSRRVAPEEKVRAWLIVILAVAPAPLASGAVSPAPAASASPWEILRSDQGIVVQRRRIAGSSLHEFRGTGMIEAPIATVLAVLDDAVHRKEWMTASVANVRIQWLSPYSEIFYSRTAAPWPIADRDVVCRTDTTFDPVNRQVRVEISSTTHPACPPYNKVVRMPLLRGHWYLWPEHGGAWTRAEYQIRVDLGGRLPEWIMNRVSRQIPHDTLIGMRQQAKRRRYPEFEKMAVAVPEFRAVLIAAGSLPGGATTQK